MDEKLSEIGKLKASSEEKHRLNRIEQADFGRIDRLNRQILLVGQRQLA